MAEINFFDVSSRDGSPNHLYADPECYLDPTASEPQSPATSPYMTYLSDRSTGSNVYPSPEADGESPRLVDPEQKPKRKRENRYKNAPPSVLSRRREQNRASQRAYRERKDQKIKDLEQEIGHLKGQINDLRSYSEMLSQQLKQANGSGFHGATSPQPPLHELTPSPYEHPGLALSSGIGVDGLNLDLFMIPDMSMGPGNGFSTMT